MSNLYDMKHGRLEMSPLRQFPAVPIVQLSGGFFKKVREKNLTPSYTETICCTNCDNLSTSRFALQGVGWGVGGGGGGGQEREARRAKSLVLQLFKT